MFFRPKKKNPLREWRMAAGLTPQDVSRVVELSPAIVEKYEKCSLASIPMSCLAKLVRTYRVPPAALINELPRLEDLFKAE